MPFNGNGYYAHDDCNYAGDNCNNRTNALQRTVMLFKIGHFTLPQNCTCEQVYIGYSKASVTGNSGWVPLTIRATR